MAKYDKLKKKKQEADEGIRNELNRLDHVGEDLERMSYIAGHADEIIANIDAEFESATQLSGTDTAFLFIATGLLTAKWLIMSTIAPLSMSYPPPHTPTREGRLTDKEGERFAEGGRTVPQASEKEISKLAEAREKRSELTDVSKSAGKKMYEDEGFRTVPQILFRPTPYDALNKSKESGIVELPFQLSGTNHHAYTLGHDPVLGHIFGTVNIMTRSITFRTPTLTTFPVYEKGNYIHNPMMPFGFVSCIPDAIASMQEDEKRLAAALIKQELHMASDKYCKTGLPIPIPASAEKLQSLIEKNWNSVEAKKWLDEAAAVLSHDAKIVAVQFAISALINEAIKILHLMLYDEIRDGAYSLYEVRTRRILLNANCIVSSSNILYSAFRTYTGGPLAGAQSLDIGGIIETTHRLISDTKFIREIKQEYLANRWDQIVAGEF